MSDMNQETERDKRRRRREGGKNKDLAERRRPLPCPESLPARATPPPTILILSSSDSEDDDEVQFAERGLGGFSGGGTASDEDGSPERPLPVSPQVNEQKSLRKGAKGPKKEASRKVLFVLQCSFKYFSSLFFQAKQKKKSHAPAAAPAVIYDVDNVASNDELLEYFDSYVRRGNKVKPRCARQYAGALR